MFAGPCSTGGEGTERPGIHAYSDPRTELLLSRNSVACHENIGIATTIKVIYHIDPTKSRIGCRRNDSIATNCCDQCSK